MGSTDFSQPLGADFSQPLGADLGAGSTSSGSPANPGADPHEWIWRILLVSIGVFMITRLIILSKQVADAAKAAKAAAGAIQNADERKVGAADGKPLVIYAVKVRASLSREAVVVVPVPVTSDKQAAQTMAVPLVMDPSPSSDVLLSDVKLGRTRHLLLAGRVWGVRTYDWARRDTYEEMKGLHCVWLVAADVPANFPLGEPAAVGGALQLSAGEADDVVKCYVLGLN